MWLSSRCNSALTFPKAPRVWSASGSRTLKGNSPKITLMCCQSSLLYAPCSWKICWNRTPNPSTSISSCLEGPPNLPPSPPRSTSPSPAPPHLMRCTPKCLVPCQLTWRRLRTSSSSTRGTPVHLRLPIGRRRRTLPAPAHLPHPRHGTPLLLNRRPISTIRWCTSTC